MGGADIVLKNKVVFYQFIFSISHTHTLTLALTYSHSATVLSEQFGLDVVLLDVVYTALYGIVFCNLILILD